MQDGKGDCPPKHTFAQIRNLFEEITASNEIEEKTEKEKTEEIFYELNLFLLILGIVANVVVLVVMCKRKSTRRDLFLSVGLW